MNVTELARKLKVPTKDMLERLPAMGYSIGKRAIKINDAMANEIISKWTFLNKVYEAKIQAKRDELEKVRKERLGKIEITKTVAIPPFITVREFAQRLQIPITTAISTLMKNGIFASLNERIDFETAQIIGDDLKVKIIEDAADQIASEMTKKGEQVEKVLGLEKKSDMQSRPPVIVVMGHVDHGKTKLLDTIRSANVAAGEAGGITQHIGAYQLVRNGKKLTFIDTPGHEAFTAMRSRGARVADIAILVVAADDSVKPQTIEALRIIEQAQLPMVVAINKIDKPGVNLDKVKSDLAQHNLTPQEWGGKTMMVPISALKGTGIEDLLDVLTLLADEHEEDIKANPTGQVVGTIVESHVDKGEGPVATLLVQNGTCRVGEYIAVDETFYGRIRAMKDWNGQNAIEAGPSMPVRILGFKVAPKVGDIVLVVKDQKGLNKKIAYQDLVRDKIASAPILVKTKDDKEEEGIKKMSIMIKADMLGSLEAIVESLEKIHHPEIRLKVIGQGLGAITEGDVQQAESSKAAILGFHVKPTMHAEQLARDKEVEIKLYKVIYDLIDDVRARLQGMLGEEVAKTQIGEVEILQIFKNIDGKVVCGGKVKAGRIAVNANALVFRQGVELGQGVITRVQVGRESVTDVRVGNDCGIEFTGKVPLEKGDKLSLFTEERRQKILT